MPDLNTAAVRTWLAEAEPAAWPPNRNAFEPLELDDGVAAAIEQLGRALDDARSADPRGFGRRLAAEPTGSLLASVLARFGPGRMLHVLNWLADPATHDRAVLLEALFAAGEAGEGEFLRSRLRELNQRTLIARIFDQDRVRLLLAACRTADRQEADR